MSVRRVKSKCKIAIKSFSTKSLRGKTEFRDVLPPIKDSLSADLPSALEATTATPSEECDSVQEMSFYANKQKSTHEDWVQIRQHLLDSFVKLQVPSSESCCSRCSQTLSEPIRCADCGPTQPMYCAECERSVHEYVLHKPEVWQVLNYYYCNIITGNNHNRAFDRIANLLACTLIPISCFNVDYYYSM